MPARAVSPSAKGVAFLFRGSRFPKEFSQSPQLFTAPDFGLQPPRLLFLVDEYPKTNRRPTASTLKPRRPALRRRQGRLPCQLTQNRPLCLPQVIACEPPPKAKANFVQPQSAQQKIGFVPSFCPTRAPIAPSPCLRRSKAPNLTRPRRFSVENLFSPFQASFPKRLRARRPTHSSPTAPQRVKMIEQA